MRTPDGWHKTEGVGGGPGNYVHDCGFRVVPRWDLTDADFEHDCIASSSRRIARPSAVRGYVVVSSGIQTDADSPSLFRDIQAWVEWCKVFKAYALINVPGEMIQADEMLMPKAIYDGSAWFPFLWRLRSMLFNLRRRAIVREFAMREARYFSEQVVNARRKASQ